MVIDEDKTREQLLSELAEVRQRLASLDEAEDRRKRAEAERDERGDIQGVLCIARESTDRKRVEEALRQSEEWFRNIYDKSPIGKEIYGSEGQLSDADKACLDMFGVSDVAEIRGFGLFDDPNLSETDKERLREGKTVRVEIPFDLVKVKNPNCTK